MKNQGKKHPNAKEEDERQRKKKKDNGNKDLPNGRDKIKPKREPKEIKLPGKKIKSERKQ